MHHNVTSKLTIALFKSFLGKGYHLYIDNWYSSVPLLSYLLQQQTICTSTARSTRVPKILKARKVAKGSTSSDVSGKLLAQKYEDKNKVYMLTTAERADTVTKQKPGGHEKILPRSIDFYNQNMGGVDCIDQY